jgi:hypothetical protein
MHVKLAILNDHKYCSHCFVSDDIEAKSFPKVYGCMLLSIADKAGTMISNHPCSNTAWDECPLNPLSDENKANRLGKVEKVPNWAKGKV